MPGTDKLQYALHLDGIEGTRDFGQNGKFKKLIPIQTWNWGLTYRARGHGPDPGTHIRDFELVGWTDRMSPKIQLACAAGAPIKEAKLFVFKGTDGKDPGLVWEFVLTECRIGSYQVGRHHGPAGFAAGEAFDRFSIHFKDLGITHVPHDGNNKPGPPKRLGWDVARNVRK
jgi:type VI protein secretion system component Hcp